MKMKIEIDSGNTEFDEAMGSFVQLIIKKFRDRDCKHGENTVTKQGNNPININTSYKDYMMHLNEEYNELMDEYKKDIMDYGLMAYEARDLAAMCFIIDWVNQIKFEQLGDLSENLRSQ